MKLVERLFSFTKGQDSLTIKINDEVDFEHIWIEDQNCWRTPDNAIKYYKWVIECVEKLKPEIANN